MKDFRNATGPVQDALLGAAAESADASAARAEQHLRSVHAQLEAIERGDIESVLALSAPDVQLDIFAPPEFPWIRQTRGIDELRAALTQNFDALENQQPEIITVVAQGNVVVLIGRERGVIRATRAPYHVEFVERFTFQDGRLTSVRIIAANAT